MSYRTKKWRLKPLLLSLRRRRNRPKLLVGLLVASLVFGFATLKYESEPATIDPAAYRPLLDAIARGESSDNYNAYFGHPDNSTVHFTTMTVAQVLQWQEEYVRQGHYSSAVGRYQIVRPTLAGLVARLKIDPSARFDAVMQDRMAIALLERRGAVQYAEKELSREQFAANIAQEWAALPKAVGDKPGESYYAGDGVNQSRLTIEEVYQAISQLERYLQG